MGRVFLALKGQPVVQRAQWRHGRRAGPAPPKKGSGTAASGSSSSKRTPTSVAWNVCSGPQVCRHPSQHLVSRPQPRVGGGAQHALGLVVVRRELGAPVGDVGPGRVGVEGVVRLVEGVGVDQRTAADADGAEERDLAHRAEAHRAEHPQARRPEGVTRPSGGEVLVGPPPTRLEHAHAVALLGQPQRGHAATEARADDEHVVVRLRHEGATSHGTPLTARVFARHVDDVAGFSRLLLTPGRTLPATASRVPVDAVPPAVRQ